MIAIVGTHQTAVAMPHVGKQSTIPTVYLAIILINIDSGRQPRLSLGACPFESASFETESRFADTDD
jgi:hypothetical protein